MNKGKQSITMARERLKADLAVFSVWNQNGSFFSNIAPTWQIALAELSIFADFSCFARAALGFVLKLLICNLFSFDCYIFSHHNGPHFVMCSHPQGGITVLLRSCVQDRQDMTEPGLEILQAAHGMSDTGRSPSACGAAAVLLLDRKNLHNDGLIAVQPYFTM